MIMLHHHKLRNKRRVDKTIDIPDFSLEGKEKMKDFLNDNEKKYRKKYIESEKLEELQQDVSIESTIHPQTYAEKIFDIQEAFEEMRDPDIYENEEAKDTAKKIYRKKNKCNILKSYDREKMHATLPISNFTERIEALKLSSLHKKLTKRESNTNKEDEDLILTEYTVTLKEAIYIFQEIVKAYENK